MQSSFIHSALHAVLNSALPSAILDGGAGGEQFDGVKYMLLFLLGVRLLFLVLACFGCLFAILSGLRTGVEWYWPAGGVLGLGLCGFMIGKVWASLKATWQQK